MVRTFTVLTEEYPNIDDIKVLLIMNGEYNISDTISNNSILPIISDIEGKKQFKGMWTLQVNDLIINIKLFKGKTACVDYMLFNGDVDLTPGIANEALVILESTKTTDNASRNTAVYQRIAKFTTFVAMYPNFKGIKVMYWCDNIWKDKLTPTAMFGMRLMETLNINMYSQDKEGTFINIKKFYKIMPFVSCDDIISSKNALPEKKGNISIRLSREDDKIFISLKLDKGSGESSGKISHDPNVGFLAGVIHSFEMVTNNPNHNKYIIKNHNVKQEYFDTNPKSKLWYSLNNVNIEFEDCTIRSRPTLPSRYFTLESEMTEKLATILCDFVSTNKTIFSNHGGCALTYITGPDNNTCSVGRNMGRPDIVFRNDELKVIEIIEGKIEKDLKKGIKQLSDAHLEGFIEQLKNLYPDYTIKKGLCITISSIVRINEYKNIEFPVKFALDDEGLFIHL